MKQRKFLITILSIISVMWVMHTLSKNFVIDPSFQEFLSKKDELLSNQMLWILMIRVHIILAIIALLTGPLGIIKRLRLKSLTFHQWNGRVYVLSIVVNFIPGLYVSFFATGGWPSTIGFFILNTLWLITTIFGYIYIKRKDVLRHSQWITRSFFLSFANMIIYIIVAITHNGLDLSYGLSYTIAVWLCWIFNLAIAEIVIKKKYLYELKNYEPF
ncbi:DUF2306 domain-containing protein [Peribacillus simplex]|uniref:DUF2306 domain-containing protein n=2 Tax=Peribacillus TaxID=2675229 RepID=A0AA90PKU0_9BACI|nr:MULTISPECIES: DUF2306 domain-containing protein [Peribacillus]MDP1421455.1 DUF2306 domain-containing protein [Peribacillus simplex]MDP1454165.1 DUF2306 domain-containing protein [Peribacillus frigoritolerans]